MNPLEDAMNKLMAYLEGANPSKKRLMPKDVFGKFDTDKSGIVSRNEFLIGLDSLEINLEEK